MTLVLWTLSCCPLRARCFRWTSPARPLPAILPLRRPATATTVLFSSVAGSAVLRSRKYLANICLQGEPTKCEQSDAVEMCRRSVHAVPEGVHDLSPSKVRD